MILFEQHELARTRESLGPNAVEVKTTGQVTCFKDNLVCTGLVCVIYQRRHLPTENIVNLNGDPRGVRDRKLDRGRRIERIRKVLLQRKLLRNGRPAICDRGGDRVAKRHFHRLRYWQPDVILQRPQTGQRHSPFFALVISCSMAWSSVAASIRTNTAPGSLSAI